MWVIMKMKPLTRRHAGLCILGSVIFANAVTIWVLDRNLRNSVYPTDQDAIIISIAFTVMNSMFILVPALIGAGLPRNHVGFRIAARCFLLVAGVYAAALSVYWWIPHHYLAGGSFVPVLGSCLWSLWMPRETWKRTKEDSSSP